MPWPRAWRGTPAASFPVRSLGAATFARIGGAPAGGDLDGLPLALELAAARMGTLGPAQLALRLEHRFQVLVNRVQGGAIPAHHDTLRAAVTWSYALLSEAERRVFERLGRVRRQLDARREAVCSGSDVPAEDVLRLLGRLVDRSLVIAAPTRDGQVRYRMLETLRAYAADALSLLERRHAMFYVTVAEAMGPRLVRTDQSALPPPARTGALRCPGGARVEPQPVSGWAQQRWRSNRSR
jgi:predicted ATPase